jgi:predicted deacylase
MEANAPPTAAAERRRLIGDVTAGAGPLFVSTGGVHGNEPAGTVALERVVEALRREPGGFRGRLLALAGNLGALAEGVRYRDVDLNRAWTAERLAELEQLTDAEAEEQRGLGELLRAAATERSPGFDAYFLDLHTSSAEGIPFACIGDTLRNRRFARGFPVPIVLGLEEQIDGALLEHLNCAGFVTLGFEGGQHGAEAAVENHEAAVWAGLASAGMLPRQDPRAVAARARLAERSRGVPPVLEIRYRHALAPRDEFRMRPGFANFGSVARGQVLAEHEGAEVRAHYAARVLLPLYQGRGDDGFFLARQISPRWLTLSAVLRRTGMRRLAPLLPGVRRHPGRPDCLLVDRRVARWFTVEVFHLLGFRKRRAHGDQLIVCHRPHDAAGPDRIIL